MEGLILLLLLVILVLIIVFNSNVNGRVERLHSELQQLRQQLKRQEENRQADTTPPVQKAMPDVPERPAPPKPEQEQAPQAPEPLMPKRVEPVPSPVSRPPVAAIAAKPATPVIPPPPSPPPPPRPGFFERNPDLEKFIGENLISKIGIAILVIAIGIFVKFAIDNDWIGPVGRVSIGLLCGGILTFIAHRLHNSYKAFSSVLIGGGIAVLYFSIALAYKDYQLFGQPVAFGIMVLITTFAVVLSLLYDRQEVGILALLGGFCVPFIVSNGSGNYVALFVYLLLLNTGLLVIAYRKAWRLLNFLCFIFTAIIFGSWMVAGTFGKGTGIYRDGLLFATLFYLLFLAINIAHNVRSQQKFLASDFGIILGNTSLYFAAGLVLIYGMKATAFVGLFSGALGAFNLLLCFLLYRNRNVDRNILYLLIGITLTFISLTIPLQLHGHYITLFWASEAVLLYWLHQRSAIALTRITSLIVWICMIISLFMDWSAVYGGVQLLPVLVNRGFVTTLYAAIATYALYWIRRKELAGAAAGSVFVPRQVYFGVSLILLYAAGAFELCYQFGTRQPSALYWLYLLTYTYLFVYMLYRLWLRGRLALIPPAMMQVMLLSAIVIYLITIPISFDLLQRFLSQGFQLGHFALHWSGAVVIGLILFELVRTARGRITNDASRTTMTWIACAVIVVYISSELALFFTEVCYRGPQSLAAIRGVYSRAGLSIVWSLCSFAFMWLGMRYKYRPLRIISLTLFLVTLIKLFVYDIQNLPVAGKIAAFFCLGVLLLVVSFMYQRLKKIITEDETKPKE